MKMKITKKELKIRFNVFDIGYGLLDELLCMENPVYYCERTQGWAFDVFIFDDIALTSGYTAFGKKVDREVLKRYNSLGRRNRDLYSLREINSEELKYNNREIINKMLEELEVIN